jgi:hypothetical protein
MVSIIVWAISRTSFFLRAFPGYCVECVGDSHQLCFSSYICRIEVGMDEPISNFILGCPSYCTTSGLSLSLSLFLCLSRSQRASIHINIYWLSACNVPKKSLVEFGMGTPSPTFIFVLFQAFVFVSRRGAFSPFSYFFCYRQLYRVHAEFPGYCAGFRVLSIAKFSV